MHWKNMLGAHEIFHNGSIIVYSAIVQWDMCVVAEDPPPETRDKGSKGKDGKEDKEPDPLSSFVPGQDSEDLGGWVIHDPLGS